MYLSLTDFWSLCSPGGQMHNEPWPFNSLQTLFPLEKPGLVQQTQLLCSEQDSAEGASTCWLLSPTRDELLSMDYTAGQQ